MGNGLVSTGTTGTTIGDQAGDPWEVLIRPAKPVLDAAVLMRQPLQWLDQRRRSRRPLFEPEQAGELIAVIPDGGRIARAGALFLDAEEVPAPESWVHAAIGLMLQTEDLAKSVDGDSYRGAVADGAFRDPEIWNRYAPGFSAGTIVRAIRQARMGALPSPGRFLTICVDQRRQFRKWHEDTAILLDLRYQIEDHLEEIGQPLLLDYSEADIVPF